VGKAIPKEKLVLIVEDDPEMMDYLTQVVGGAGFKTEPATDGLVVMEKMRTFSPDAAILDLMLPKYGGLELLYELRRGATANVPLIIVTARFTGPSDRAVITKQPNVAAFFEKPVGADELLQALHGALGTGPAGR
jgi:DNA-binding response OmpR family regulator